MTMLQRLGAFLLCLLATLMGSSAYIVYRNTLTGYPVGASFFWFSLFAFISALCMPTTRSPPFYVEPPGASWWRSLKKVSLWFYLLDGLLYTLDFACILYNLHSRELGVVVTILIVAQIRPIATTILGVRFLHDTCKSWTVFVVGGLMTIAGVIIYGYPSKDEIGVDTANATFLGINLVILIAFIGLVFEVVQGTIDAYYRRKTAITQADASANLFASATILGFIWMLMEHTFIEASPGLPPLPTAAQLAPLAFLGLAPTALGAIMRNVVRDQLGVPTVDVIGNMRPVFAIIIGLIPFSWFATKNPSFTPEHTGGILLTVAGTIIVALFAKGEAAKQPTKS